MAEKQIRSILKELWKSGPGKAGLLLLGLLILVIIKAFRALNYCLQKNNDRIQL